MSRARPDSRGSRNPNAFNQMLQSFHQMRQQPTTVLIDPLHAVTLVAFVNAYVTIRLL